MLVYIVSLYLIAFFIITFSLAYLLIYLIILIFGSRVSKSKIDIGLVALAIVFIIFIGGFLIRNI